jgi:hypothetical protein
MMTKNEKPIRYSLLVMRPGASQAWPPRETDEPLLSLPHAATRFQPFHAGDEISLRDFVCPDEARRQFLARLVLRVVKVRHVLGKGQWLIDDKVILFTENATPQPVNGTSPAGEQG